MNEHNPRPLRRLVAAAALTATLATATGVATATPASAQSVPSTETRLTAALDPTHDRWLKCMDSVLSWYAFLGYGDTDVAHRGAWAACQHVLP